MMEVPKPIQSQQMIPVSNKKTDGLLTHLFNTLNFLLIIMSDYVPIRKMTTAKFTNSRHFNWCTTNYAMT